MRRATTAHSSRSPRNLGKIRPRLTSPTPWPARPMRCSPRATDLGDSICRTRSTAPMSIPSSSELVATRQGSSPALSSSSTLVRSSRASEPWWARAISASASSLRRSATRSAERRLLTKTIVELWLAHELEQLGVDRRPDRAARGLAAGEPARADRIRARPPRRDRRVRSSTRRAPRCAGRAPCGAPASTIVTSRCGPTRKRPISSSGFWVALRPIRCDGRPRLRLEALEREREVRAALGVGDGVDLVDDHRLDPAEHLARVRGEDQVQRLGRRDEDVGRVAQPWRRARAGGCRPVRIATRTSSRRVGGRCRSRARGGCARCRRRVP